MTAQYSAIDGVGRYHIELAQFMVHADDNNLGTFWERTDLTMHQKNLISTGYSTRQQKGHLEQMLRRKPKPRNVWVSNPFRRDDQLYFDDVEEETPEQKRKRELSETLRRTKTYEGSSRFRIAPKFLLGMWTKRQKPQWTLEKEVEALSKTCAMNDRYIEELAKAYAEEEKLIPFYEEIRNFPDDEKVGWGPYFDFTQRTDLTAQQRELIEFGYNTTRKNDDIAQFIATPHSHAFDRVDRKNLYFVEISHTFYTTLEKPAEKPHMGQKTQSVNQ